LTAKNGIKYEIFTQSIKEIPKIADLTQSEAAEELKISLQTYKHYEAGRRCPSLEMAAKIADVFNITLG